MKFSREELYSLKLSEEDILQERTRALNMLSTLTSHNISLSRERKKEAVWYQNYVKKPSTVDRWSLGRYLTSACLMSNIFDLHNLNIWCVCVLLDGTNNNAEFVLTGIIQLWSQMRAHLGFKFKLHKPTHHNFLTITSVGEIL